MLTIVNVGYPLAPVGLDAVGGAEQILAGLDAALAAAGHRSIVIAPCGSVCCGELRATPLPDGPIDVPSIWRCHDAVRAELREVLRDEHVDLIHFHGVDCADYLPDVDVPILVTLHLWPDAYPTRLFASSRRTVTLQCVSHAQQRACPPSAAALVIPNGVDLRQLSPQPSKDTFALALGRICPEKAFHLAIDAAKAAGVPMLIGGVVFPYPAHRRYFDDVIVPRLDGQRRFLGPLDRVAKRRFLAAARCVVISSRVRETSSLVAMESLASGTPVVAVRTPALEEVVEDGNTGLLVESIDAMDRALRAVDRIKPADCRQSAEDRCSAERMVREYLDCYGDLAARRPARGAARRRTVEVVESIERLESIRDEWTQVADACPWTTPFHRPEWLLPWTRHLLRDRLACVTIRDARRLLAVLPFVRAARGDETILELAGGTVSDYRGSIVRTEAIPSVAEMVRRVLVSDFRDCARLRLGDLQPADVLLHIDVGSDRRIDPQPDPCPVLLRDGIPSRMIANVSYYRRRAERRGRVTFDVATLDRLDEFVAALFRLHAARWSHRGQPGVLVDRAVQAFHCEVIREMARAGALALTALRIDGVIAAIAYCLRVGGRTCYYLGGFDPRFADLSPGTLVLAEAVDRAWRDGAIAFDFLRGRERYKYLWGAVDRSTFSVDARLG